MKAMILAAGLGTRLQPFTHDKPKALVEINGRTQLELVISRLTSFGFKNILINVHHFAEMVIDYLNRNNNFGASIEISDERDELLDTGGGIKKASPFFNNGDPFLVHNVDVYTNLNLSQLYLANLASGALATLAVKSRETSRPFLINPDNIICGWKNNITGEVIMGRPNEKKLRPLAFSGIQVINPVIFKYMDKEGPFSITEFYLHLAKKHTIEGFPHENDIWIDLGRKENLSLAEEYIH